MELTKESKILALQIKKFQIPQTSSLYSPFFSLFYEDIKTSIPKTNISLNNILPSSKSIQERKRIIHNSGQIPKPTQFRASSFPFPILTHIDSTIKTVYSIPIPDFSLQTQNNSQNQSQISKGIIYLCLEEPNLSETKIKKIIFFIYLWLIIIQKYAPPQCSSKKLNIYLYLTNLKKELPLSKNQNQNQNQKQIKDKSPSPSLANNDDIILDELNVNTAFTASCVPHQHSSEMEIIIFRKEEWFKVFIHETFHSFGLDFSGLSESAHHHCRAEILSIFPVKSDVNLYEAYTECWAEIINVCFCAAFKGYSSDPVPLGTGVGDRGALISSRGREEVNDASKSTNQFINSKSTFLSNVNKGMEGERVFGLFQMCKILDYMGIYYEDLYKQKKENKSIRDLQYREKTSILAYYVIKNILLYDYPGFLSWCSINNSPSNPFLFRSQSQQSQQSQTLSKFCQYIQKQYKKPDFIHTVLFIEDLFDNQNNTIEKLNKREKKEKRNVNVKDFVWNNTRMTMNEFAFF